MFISTSKPRVITSLILTASLFAFLILLKDEFLDDEVKSGTLLFVLCFVCSLLIGTLTAIKFNFKPKIQNTVHTVILFLLPVVSMTMVECLNYCFIYDFYWVDFFTSYVLYILFYGLIFAFTGSYKLSVLIINPIFFIFGLANYYIYTFKGSPFVPMDFMSISTAKDVASSYDFSFTYQIAISVVLLTAIIVIGSNLKTPKMHISGKLITRISSGAAIIIVSLIFFFTDIFANCGLEPDFWNQSRGYHKSGFLLNFCLNTKYLYVTKPADYDASTVEDYIDEITDENTSSKEDKTPNIICIMNESFSDLSVCGDFTTNKEPLSFFNSLTENTVRGNLYVPVHGSGTSNTEYEFLTGNSTSFFPAGSNAYMLYIKDKVPSLVSTLSSCGYSKTAFHPYYSSGWNRKTVYNNLGFERFISITSIINPSILNDYINSRYNVKRFNDLCNAYYPGENKVIRQYVSDSCNYENVISYFEERDTSKPYFMFNVTMQNHGGYTTDQSVFTSDVKLTSTKGSYPKAEQYLSLLKKSDEAFEELIDYFTDYDEPTIICMFGDHQPNIEEEFYEEIMGVDSLDKLSLEDAQKRYVTPFVIWANYDIQEEYIDKLSVNYLSSYLLKVAGVKTTKYNDYLYSLSKQIPVINNLGYIGADGNYYENGEKSKYSDLIKKYKIIQYNNAFDKDNKKNSVFYN